MNDNRRLFWILLTLSLTALSASFVTGWNLYKTAITVEKGRLRDTVISQARLMESVGVFDIQHAIKTGQPISVGIEDTLKQFQNAHTSFKGLGKTGEFALAKRSTNQITFLLKQRHNKNNPLASIAWDAVQAEPMRRALKGESGVMVGLDYRGKMVLAAYEPVTLLGYGVVAKIDLDEVREPFYNTGTVVLIISMVLVLFGTAVVYKITIPVMNKLHRQKNQLSEALNLQELIFENIGLGIVLYKGEQIVKVNQKTLEIFGFESHEMGEFAAKYFFGGEAKHNRIIERAGNLFRARKVYKGQIQLHKKDGEPFWGTLVGKAIKSEDFSQGSVWILDDITEIKIIEQNMLQLQSAINEVPDAIFIINGSGEVVFQNKGFEAIQNIFPFDLLKAFDPNSTIENKKFNQIIHKVEGEGIWKGELFGNESSTEKTYFQTTISKIPNINAEESDSFAFIVIDITAERNLQAQQMQSLKMESLGTLAGGVAHEINNPVGFVGSNLGTMVEYLQRFERVDNLYSQIIKGITEDNPKLKDWVQDLATLKKEIKFEFIKEDIPCLTSDMLEGLSRIKTIVKNLRDFTHVDDHILGEIDLNEALKKSVKIAWSSLKYKCTIIEDFGEIPLVECYPQEINQVLLNLIINASQAIENKGNITIRTTRHYQNVLLQVEDTGKGIEPKYLARIFEPFFTTKDIGKGTGLGLSVSYKIIKDHNGEINVSSKIGEGTLFTVTLPIVHKSNNTFEG
ncbi:MAG: ATP-binding protein [SAR324 cluster bacterium]|nr:ATP-binding protein [SAR324 cluster bacterium]